MKEDCIKIFKPGKKAYVYPEKRLMTPKKRTVEDVYLKKVRVERVESDSIVLEDGRVYRLQNYYGSGCPLGGYLAVHRLTPLDLPDTVVFPSTEALAKEIEYQFIIKKLNNLYQSDWDGVSFETLRGIDRLLCGPDSPDIPDDVGEVKNGHIKKEPYRQGYVFKSWKNYLSADETLPVYVPELTDTIYTKKDIIRICNGQQDFARELFETLDWQHAESQLEDILCSGEWETCPRCKAFVKGYRHDGITKNKRCPHCGKRIHK